MGDAYPVREIKAFDELFGPAGGRIVTEHTAVRSAFDDLERIGRRLVTGGAVAEVDLSVRRDVEVVRHAHT